MDEIREKFGQMPDVEREELKRRIAELESRLETEYERGRKDQREADAVIAENIERKKFESVGNPMIKVFVPYISIAIREQEIN